MIREAVIKERELGGDEVIGIAGGASGGDILFHEVCEEIQIPTRLFLAVTKDLFVESVRQGGPGWVERFNKLCARVPPRELATRFSCPSGFAARVTTASGSAAICGCCSMRWPWTCR